MHPSSWPQKTVEQKLDILKERLDAMAFHIVDQERTATLASAAVGGRLDHLDRDSREFRDIQTQDHMLSLLDRINRIEPTVPSGAGAFSPAL